MAIYRPPKPRWPLATAAAVAGLAAGALIGLSASDTEIDPTEAAGEIRASLLAAAGSLEVAAVEYDEAVEAGSVKRQSEYQGALAALDSSRKRYIEVRDALVNLVPRLVEQIDRLYDDVERAMDARVDAREVTARVLRLEDLLKGEALS